MATNTSRRPLAFLVLGTIGAVLAGFAVWKFTAPAPESVAGPALSTERLSTEQPTPTMAPPSQEPEEPSADAQMLIDEQFSQTPQVHRHDPLLPPHAHVPGTFLTPTPSPAPEIPVARPEPSLPPQPPQPHRPPAPEEETPWLPDTTTSSTPPPSTEPQEPSEPTEPTEPSTPPSEPSAEPEAPQPSPESSPGASAAGAEFTGELQVSEEAPGSAEADTTPTS